MNTKRLQYGTDALGMLLCQELCRGHNGALIAVEGGDKQGCGCHSRFIGSIIALKETAHGPVLLAITQDFVDNETLSSSETKWQRCLTCLINTNLRPGGGGEC